VTIKTKIIVTFSLLTAILVIITSRVGYISVREIYLNQLSDQINLLTRLIAGDINPKYLPFIDAGAEDNLAISLYEKNIQSNSRQMLLTNIFIFNKNFKILVQSAKGTDTGDSNPRLLLNRTEIQALEIGQSTTSLPFKGADGEWYLWGFCRLDETHWLGIQENAARLARVEALSNVFWVIGIIGVLVTIFFGWILARTIARPIDRLVSFSSLLGKEKFDTPLPAGVKGELAILAGALDKMRQDLGRHHKERETMLAQIAHEIRNPLGGIELLAGLVKEDLAKSGISTEYINKILDETASLKALISAYLIYSRPLPATPETLSVGELIQEIEEIIYPDLQKKKISLTYHGNNPEIRFDRQHLRQILLNLISNSIEAADPGGNILVEARQNENQAAISVSDDGTGIAEDNMDWVFEPFFTTRGNGTGLGLAVCKKLCKENRAEIEVKNNTGKGCTFTIISEQKSAIADNKNK
jgi:signal transduction histidine kinase